MSSPTGILKDNTDHKKIARIKWDEQNLEFNEQAKTPRMKIDEPPTPYLPPQNWDEEEHATAGAASTGSPELAPLAPTAKIVSNELDAADLERNMAFLAAAATEKRSRMHKRSDSHDSDASGGSAKSPRSPRVASTDFDLRRKLHYDEGHKMKQALSQKQVDDDDE